MSAQHATRRAVLTGAATLSATVTARTAAFAEPVAPVLTSEPDAELFALGRD